MTRVRPEGSLQGEVPPTGIRLNCTGVMSHASHSKCKCNLNAWPELGPVHALYPPHMPCTPPHMPTLMPGLDWVRWCQKSSLAHNCSQT